MEHGKKRPWPLYRQLLCTLFQANDHELGLAPSTYPAPATFDLDHKNEEEPMDLAARLAVAIPHPRASSPDADGSRSLDRRSFLGIGGAALASTILSFAGDQARGDPFTSALLEARWLHHDTANAEAPTLVELSRAVVKAKADYQACRYTDLAAQLPQLLALLDAATSSFIGDDAHVAQSLCADAYHVAASLELKLGNEGPAWMAADASLRAARQSGDPVMIGSSARIVTHALMDSQRYIDAQRVAATSAEELSATWTQPSDDALSVYGSLLLRGAIAAGRQDDEANAVALLDEAEQASRRLGHDGNHRWTAFGPTNVTLHRVNIAVALGNAGTAIQHRATISPDKLVVTERKAHLFLDVAHAYSQWGKHEQAYHALCRVHEIAPEELSGRPWARRLVAETAIGAAYPCPASHQRPS